MASMCASGAGCTGLDRRVKVYLQVRRQVHLGYAGDDDGYLLGLTVQYLGVDVLGLHGVVDRLQEIWVNFRQKIVQSVPEPSQVGYSRHSASLSTGM